MNVVIAFLLGALAGLATKPSQQQNSQKLTSQTQRQGDTPPIARPTPYVPPSISNNGNGEDQKNNPHEAIKFWLLQVGGFIVVTAYAAFTLVIMCASLKSATAAREQTDLFRLQMIATQSAVIRVDKTFSADDNNPDNGRIDIVVQNEGRSLARNVFVQLEITKRRIGQEGIIGEPMRIEINTTLMQPDRIRPTSRRYPLPMQAAD